MNTQPTTAEMALRDPVCGMTAGVNSEHRLVVDGGLRALCIARCKSRFATSH